MRTHHLGKTPGTGQSRRTADLAATPAPRMAASVYRYAVDDVLPSPSQPLAAPLNEEMKGCLGTDFTRVPVHTSAARDSAVHDVLRRSGQPLAAPLNEEMEARLGADFSHVRVHTDSAARASAAGVGARAYTSGSHVVIGYGGADKHILAHELTHVIQQRSGPVAGTGTGAGLRVSDPSDCFERQAEANASRVMAMGVADRVGPVVHGSAAQSQPSVGTVTTAPTVQRTIFSGIFNQAAAASRVPLLRQDPPAQGQPRQTAIDHINRIVGNEERETVGSGVRASIEGIQLAAGERGARDVDRVFTNSRLTELYKIKRGEPGFDQAHEMVARSELEFWQGHHATNPSVGTGVAVGVDVPTRVALQQNMGTVGGLARQWLETAAGPSSSRFSSPFE